MIISFITRTLRFSAECRCRINDIGCRLSPRMRRTDVARSMTSICVASSSTSTTVRLHYLQSSSCDGKGWEYSQDKLEMCSAHHYSNFTTGCQSTLVVILFTSLGYRCTFKTCICCLSLSVVKLCGPFKHHHNIRNRQKATLSTY